eukprot:gene4210-5272_t
MFNNIVSLFNRRLPQKSSPLILNNIIHLKPSSSSTYFYSTTNLTPQPWKKLLFTDLHVSSNTLERTLEVLKSIRLLSSNKKQQESTIPVVFLGDFWHQRHSLQVRHIDQLLQEFDHWNRENIPIIIIPGNHDQVSLDGQVHGVQLFSLFPNITVATNPIFDENERCAYLPWRETKEEQQQLFNHVSELGQRSNEPWTVFAHAEVKGAISNGGHRANGKIDASHIGRGKGNHIRACYLGHYHKRQHIEPNTWYIGSPYQQNFGEMYDPHGVAFVNSSRAEPEFINFDHLPSHHRIKYPLDFQPGGLADKIKSKDIVEISAEKDDLKKDEFVKALDSLPPFLDIRRIMIPSTEVKSTTNNLDSPSTSLSSIEQNNNTSNSNLQSGKQFKLIDFLEDYIKIQNVKNSNTDTDESKDKELLYLGKEILSSITEPSIVPMGRKIVIERIMANDFCGIKGKFEMCLSSMKKMSMIKGAMGIGKSTIFEALVWGLYGTTSPRKQNTTSASLKGDEVINDQSSNATVVIDLLVDSVPVTIQRSKKKGSGSKVVIDGLDHIKQGVLDQQSLINNIIGLDYELFRISVYSGQGSLLNFATYTDKKRKEVLSSAFNLGICQPANKIAKEQKKRQEFLLMDINRKISNLQSSLNTWKSIDYIKDSFNWNEKRNLLLKEIEDNIKQQNLELDELTLKENELNGTDSKSSLKTEKKKLNQMKKEVEIEKESYSKESMNNIMNSLNLNSVSKDIVVMELEIQKYQEKIEHLKKHMELKTCTQCNQTIGSKDIVKLEEQLKDLDTKTQSLSIKLAESKEEEKKIKIKREEMKKEREDKLKSYDSRIMDFNDRLNKIEPELEVLQTYSSRIKFLQDSIKANQLRCKSMKTENDPFLDKIIDRDQKITELESQILANEDTSRQIEHKLKQYEYWETAFSSNGIPMMTLSTLVKELECYANEYLSKLSMGKLFTNLSVDDEDLIIEVMELDNITGKVQPRSYYQLSGGQRRLVELCYSPLALGEIIFNHTGSRVMCLIFDELTNHLDSTVKPQICDLLSNLKEKNNIIVVDHDSSIQGEFDQIYSLEKENNTINRNENGSWFENKPDGTECEKHITKEVGQCLNGVCV